MLKPLLYTRSFGFNPYQVDTWLNVSAARWAAEGGPDIAQLSGINAAEGPGGSTRVHLDLARALTLLRCPVDLVDETGQPAWWGFVSAIELRQEGITVHADPEPMANRVKAVYTALPLETNQWTVQQLESSWYEDLDSQAAYGVKERVIHLYDSTPLQAVAACGVALADSGWPQALPSLTPPLLPKNGGAGGVDVVIFLRGWWHTLGWKYYANPEGLIENLYEGPGTQLMGGSSVDASVYQGFSVTSGGWRAQQVWLKAALRGSPGDSMQVDVCQDNGGAPGASLASAAVGHAAFSNTFAWHCFEFASPPVLDAGPYWLWVHRTGATHGSNKYILKVDEYESYPDGTAWVTGAPRSPAADLLFRVAGGMETTAQLSAMADPAAGGQFLQGVRLDAASGVFTNPYRAGNLTALEEIRSHLRAGNADSVKLQAEVTQDRYLRVWLKPEPGTAGICIDRQGLLTTLGGVHLPAWAPAAGRWAVVGGAWGEVGSAYQQVKDRVLLETVAYDPESGGLRAG